MAIDPSISLAVQPPKFESPTNMLAQALALQNATQQNKLGQLQMSEYERARAEEEGLRNYLRSADLTSPETRRGLLQYGKTGLAYGKALADQEAAALEQKTKTLKYKADLAEQAGRIYNTVKDEASWQAARSKLAALGGDPSTLPLNYDPNFIKSELAQALTVKDQWEFTKPKVEQVKVGDRILFRDMNPNSPTFGKEAMAPEKVGMTPFESAKLAQDATGVVYQEDANGNIVALPSKLKAGELPKARVAMAPGGGLQPLTAKPSEAVGKEQMSINQQRAIVRGAIDAVTNTPDAFGLTRGMMGETLGGRMGTSEENQARSYLFNVVSGVIKERAGTAQSAAEAETLARFLPQPTDAADVIKDKMLAFDKYLSDKESGTTKKKPAAAASFPGAPKVGTVQDGYRYKGGNPAEPSSWEKQ